MPTAKQRTERLDSLLAMLSDGRAVRVEAKFVCDSAERLTSSGLRVRLVAPRHFEDNWVYSLPEGPDRSQQRLRVRYLYDQGSRRRLLGCLLTYKGSPGDRPRAALRNKRVRERFETTVDEPDQVRLILARLGLTKRFRYQKYRRVYRVELPGDVALLARFDETPFGDFVELEGEDSAIDDAAARLGYAPGDAIAESYFALWRAACRTRRQSLPDLVFAPERDSAA